MIIYIIKWTFIYVALIFLLHNLYLFFQNNLTSTKFKDYYNTYNSYNSYKSEPNNNSQIKNMREKNMVPSSNLQINSTSLEEINKYSDYANYNNGFSNQEFINQEFSNSNNNGLTNDMKSELNDFFNKLKL
jgi:hypothetical protein